MEVGQSMNLAWLGRFYLWFWYHTEFFLTPLNRRPYTFIMRDWIYTHANISGWLIIGWFCCMVILSHYYGMTATILSIFTALLTAHLIWGSKWIEGEMDISDCIKEGALNE